MSAMRSVCLVIASTFLWLSANNALGQGAEMEFDDDVKYDVIIQVTEYNIETVKAVKILTVDVIGNRLYLIIMGTEFAAKHKGYILLDVVKAILPVGVQRERHIVPEPTILVPRH